MNICLIVNSDLKSEMQAIYMSFLSSIISKEHYWQKPLHAITWTMQYKIFYRHVTNIIYPLDAMSSLDRFHNMDVSIIYYAKWKKSDTKGNL